MQPRQIRDPRMKAVVLPPEEPESDKSNLTEYVIVSGVLVLAIWALWGMKGGKPATQLQSTSPPTNARQPVSAPRYDFFSFRFDRTPEDTIAFSGVLTLPSGQQIRVAGPSENDWNGFVDSLQNTLNRYANQFKDRQLYLESLASRSNPDEEIIRRSVKVLLARSIERQTDFTPQWLDTVGLAQREMAALRNN